MKLGLGFGLNKTAKAIADVEPNDMLEYRGTFDYQDTVAKNLIELPAGTKIWEIRINETIIFDGALGNKWHAAIPTDSQYFGVSQPEINENMYHVDNTMARIPRSLTIETYINVTYIGISATQGEADIIIRYSLPEGA